MRLVIFAAVLLFAASCGSDEGFGDTVESGGANDGVATSAENVETDNTDSEPIATTAPIAEPIESGGDAEGDLADDPTPAPAATSGDGDTGDAAPAEADDATTSPAPASSAELSRNFGGNDTTCRSVIISFGQDDSQATKDCLFGEIEAGRPVVVDFALISTEGDPLYYRYAYDGQQIFFVNDSRLDAFGQRTVTGQLCQSIEPGSSIPIPKDCSPSTSTGFAEADG